MRDVVGVVVVLRVRRLVGVLGSVILLSAASDAFHPVPAFLAFRHDGFDTFKNALYPMKPTGKIRRLGEIGCDYAYIIKYEAFLPGCLVQLRRLRMLMGGCRYCSEKEGCLSQTRMFSVQCFDLLELG